MKNYERPIVLATEDLAEGVYAASGATCYMVTSFGCQEPYLINEVNKSAWTVHVAADHVDAGHHSTDREISITFSYPVTVYSMESNTRVLSGDGTNTIVVSLSHHNNPTDNIKLSGFVVLTDTSITDLKIIDTDVSNCNQTCGCF